MRFKISLIILALYLLSIGIGVSFAQVKYISIATGGTAGVYYPLGGAMADIFTKKVPGVNATAQATGASIENVRLIAGGKVELGLIQNDIAFYAFKGVELFKEPVAVLRGITMLYPEVIQIVTLTEANIRSVDELRGKRVAVGAPGSGTEANARQILEAHGIAYKDLKKADFLPFGQAVDQVRDGHLDAAFLTAGVPTPAIMDLATMRPVRILPIETEVVKRLQASYPFYTRFTIPSRAYRGQVEEVPTVAVMAMLVTSSVMEEKLIYDLTKAIFENLGTLGAAHAKGKEISLEKAKEGMPIPLHPGAERYYREAGK